jgi:hypothetical protein
VIRHGLLGLTLLLGVCALACEREPKTEPEVSQHEVELDLGAIRVAIVDGLEATVRDPTVAEQLGFAARLDTPEVESARERLLARMSTDPELGRIADAFFLALQDSPAMRAALLEYVRQHPELVDADLTALRDSFVADLQQRLTREEIAELLEQQLRTALQDSEEALAQAWVSEAGGASAVAAAVLVRLEDPVFRSKLEQWLGRDGLQSVLVRRFADPKRGAELLLGIAKTLGASQAMVEILDHPRTAQLLAGALGRVLADEQVRTRCEEAFALALAPELDPAAFTRVLSQLLDEPALSREAKALLSAVAREPATRAVIVSEVEAIAAAPEFDALLLQTLD